MENLNSKLDYQVIQSELALKSQGSVLLETTYNLEDWRPLIIMLDWEILLLLECNWILTLNYTLCLYESLSLNDKSSFLSVHSLSARVIFVILKISSTFIYPLRNIITWIRTGLIFFSLEKSLVKLPILLEKVSIWAIISKPSHTPFQGV